MVIVGWSGLSDSAVLDVWRTLVYCESHHRHHWPIGQLIDHFLYGPIYWRESGHDGDGFARVSALANFADRWRWRRERAEGARIQARWPIRAPSGATSRSARRKSRGSDSDTVTESESHARRKDGCRSKPIER